MGQALYRKYRSKSLDDIVGQEDIVKTLKQALKQGRISHAYLFTGPRGVGKTSIARILAHEINGLPYQDDAVHIDIIEIDAASNRRIDEIRELREKVYVAPTSAKYKVYIIDEVHMLTREAFNALLKTLEEPPAHVVFILATTDAHKVPDTIISRTQRFNFKPIDKAKALELLKQIAAAEKIQISNQALELLAEHGDGSLRDSESLLDQAASHGGKIEVAAIQQLLGLPPASAIDTLLVAVLGNGSSADIINGLDQLYNQGYQASAIAKQLGQTVRRGLVNGDYSQPQALELLGQLIEVPASHDSERFLEIVLLQQRPPAAVAAVREKAPVVEEAREMPIQEDSPESGEEELEPLPEEVQASPEPADEPKTAVKSGTAAFDASLWAPLLQSLKKRHNTIYSVVRMAQPTFSDDSLTLAFAFPFHQKRINEAANRQLLTDIISELTGQKVTLDCVVDAAASPPPVPVQSTDDEPPINNLSTINSIFGSTELLES